MHSSFIVLWIAAAASCWAQAGTQQIPAPASSQGTAEREKIVQDKNKLDTADHPASENIPIPAYTLEFREQEKQAGDTLASSFIILPIRCSSDGTPFFNMINPPNSPGKPFDPLQQTVYSLSPRGSHSFSIRALSDLDDVRFIAVDADESQVAFLVSARRKSEQTISPADLPPGAVLKTKSYIALFDRSGAYTKSVEVGVDYGPSDLALLSSGEFVVFGYDSVNAAVRVSLLGSGGEFISPITFSDEMVSNPALKEAETGTMHERVKALERSGIGSWRFARSRGRALLYEPGSTAPVLEIGEGGVKREVPLSAPPDGYSLDAFLPATDRWIARYKRAGLPKQGEFDTSAGSENLALYELNPNDGSPQYRIDLGKDNGVGILDIACEKDGAFLAFKSNKDSKLVLLNAYVPH